MYVLTYLPINTSTSLQKWQVIGQILKPEQIFFLYFENRNALEQYVSLNVVMFKIVGSIIQTCARIQEIKNFCIKGGIFSSQCNNYTIQPF